MKSTVGETVVSVLGEVGAERFRQDKRFGEQNHSPADWLVILGEEYGESCKEACEARYDEAAARQWSKEGSHGTAVRFAEAGAGRLRKLRAELIQVAAVAVAMIESLDRNELKGPDNAKL